jgi:hypothetical protein
LTPPHNTRNPAPQEDDPRLDEEDRALARFQAQRVREARRDAKFALADDGEGCGYGADGRLGGWAGAAGGRQKQEGCRGRGTMGRAWGVGSAVAPRQRCPGTAAGGPLLRSPLCCPCDPPPGGPVLTHGGRSLDDLEDLSGRPDALADLEEAELAELERQLHFGGGGEGDGEEGGGGEGRRRSRKEVRAGMARRGAGRGSGRLPGAVVSVVWRVGSVAAARVFALWLLAAGRPVTSNKMFNIQAPTDGGHPR